MELLSKTIIISILLHEKMLSLCQNIPIYNFTAFWFYQHLKTEKTLP